MSTSTERGLAAISASSNSIYPEYSCSCHHLQGIGSCRRRPWRTTETTGSLATEGEQVGADRMSLNPSPQEIELIELAWWFSFRVKYAPKTSAYLNKHWGKCCKHTFATQFEHSRYCWKRAPVQVKSQFWKLLRIPVAMRLQLNSGWQPNVEVP